MVVKKVAMKALCLVAYWVALMAVKKVASSVVGTVGESAALLE